jgi:hypothetical protein
VDKPALQQSDDRGAQNKSKFLIVRNETEFSTLSCAPNLEPQLCLIHGGIGSFCILPFDLLGDADELVVICIVFVETVTRLKRAQ